MCRSRDSILGGEIKEKDAGGRNEAIRSEAIEIDYCKKIDLFLTY